MFITAGFALPRGEERAFALTRTTLFTCTIEFGSIGTPRVHPAEVEMLLRSLGARFTRFDPDSETSRLNRSAGRWQDITPEMHALLCQSLTAAVASKGLVNVAILNPLIAAGYDRHWPFDAAVAAALAPAAAPLPPLTEILEVQSHRVRLTPGYAVDFGGVAKGLWAEMVTDLLGPNSVCSVGGDVACRGSGRLGDGWAVRIPSGDVIRVTDGGVATSGTAKRRWNGGMHHIIDPRTSLPSTSDVSQATVIADRCSTAEWAAKAIVVDGTTTRRRTTTPSGYFRRIQRELRTLMIPEDTYRPTGKMAEPRVFRGAFRALAAPVAVLLVAIPGGGVRGMTATSAVSLSGEPPMVLICPDDKTGMAN